MNTNDCDRVRMHLMAEGDAEVAPVTSDDREHMATCTACQAWLHQFAAMRDELAALPYLPAPTDVWPAVNAQIDARDERAALVRRLWPIGLLALGWRVVQLFADLPSPAVVAMVPIAAAVLIAWRLGGELLAIETSAPELARLK